MTEHRHSRSLVDLYWKTIVRPNLAKVCVVLGLMIMTSVLEMASIGLSVPLLEDITNRGGPDGTIVRLMASALAFVGIVDTGGIVQLALLTTAVVLFMTAAASQFLHQYLTAGIAYRIRLETRNELFERFLNARYEDAMHRGRGRIFHEVDVPAGAVHSTIRQLGLLLTAVFNSVLLLALMFYLSWWATIMIAMFVLLGLRGLRKVLDRRAESHGRHLDQLQGTQKAVEIDAIDGLRVVKAQGVADKVSARQRELLEAEMHPLMRLALFRQAPLFLNEAAAATIVLALATFTFVYPTMGMTFPFLVAFLLSIRKVAPAVASINSTLVVLHTARRNVELIEEIRERLPMEDDSGRPAPPIDIVRFETVAFAYSSRGEEKALENIDLTLEKGSLTVVVGETGSGKSTLADLLLRLHRPGIGRIMVGDVDLSEIRLAEWRSRIGYVGQDVFLFNCSIRENLALWDGKMPMSKIEDAARLAGAHGFISQLPEGYETVVGDRGLELSGGQRQRIAIARAILEMPDILIFDEATSALDNETERAVYEAIYSLRTETIVLVIAHRLSTIREADQILVLGRGRIVERGTHNSLMNAEGIYSRLYRLDDAGVRSPVLTPEGDSG